ncbi:methyltransferase domain-containing protein [Streptomyces sp. DG2A-72]|uniref:methyltransferase domain-containing protein n=1 Tax=Streptomyces sp. DG2A-72 TaxID=3051386 RepID=UPI00265BFE17|nr:methyltransferase domain-containing protein [Streptomyces sp. DG2A-72]MDO0933842.1 methyltransferase domain-containing protein [Streptomyces sp. DG2A-72]
MSRYLFDNTDARTPARFSTLESCYDPVSRRQLELTGLAAGFRCLEVGGGGGSLGAWMGERVGAEGEVTVTDLDPRWAESRPRPPQVRLLRHDIVNDPLPGGDYDVIHARLVLLHLPERIAVLERLVAALRPGGWLLLEEFDCTWIPVLATPDEDSTALFTHVQAALLAQLEKAGADVAWGRRVPAAMTRAGLTDVTATTYAESWAGGGAGIDLHRVNMEQAEVGLRGDGVTEGELRRFYALLKNPGFVINSYPLISTRGRRPESGEGVVG